MEKSGKEKERNNKFTIKMQKKLVVLYLCVLLAFAGLSARLMIINRDDGIRRKFCPSSNIPAVPFPLKGEKSWIAKGRSWP